MAAMADGQRTMVWCDVRQGVGFGKMRGAVGALPRARRGRGGSRRAPSRPPDCRLPKGAGWLAGGVAQWRRGAAARGGPGVEPATPRETPGRVRTQRSAEDKANFRVPHGSTPPRFKGGTVWFAGLAKH